MAQRIQKMATTDWHWKIVQSTRRGRHSSCHDVKCHTVRYTTPPLWRLNPRCHLSWKRTMRVCGWIIPFIKNVRRSQVATSWSICNQAWVIMEFWEAAVEYWTQSSCRLKQDIQLFYIEHHGLQSWSLNNFMKMVIATNITLAVLSAKYSIKSATEVMTKVEKDCVVCRRR